MTEHTVTLNNGIKMPILGLGIYLISSEEMDDAVRYALEAGYRSFDTAQMYDNEEYLGSSLQKTGIARKELFITSKVDNPNQGFDSTLKSFDESLKKLKTDYVDLFLIHWPGQNTQRCLQTWRALEKLYRDGVVRAIGVCNFHVRHLEWIFENSDVTPVINQIERHPLFNQKELIGFCKKYNIQTEAWRPLLRGNFETPQIQAIADRYGKTPAQIILRWNIQGGVMVIPKSVHRERIFENADIFDFELEKQDMELIDKMDIGKRTGADPDIFDF